MNNTITALQALYVKMGGSLTDTYDAIADGVAVADYSTIPDMIEACAQKVTSGGSSASLPAVTAADNDKVLTVVEGAWDKADAQGGNNDFVVTYTMGDNDAMTADKTFAEISTAIEAGKNVKALVATSELSTICYLASYGTTEIDFNAFGATEPTTLEFTTIVHNSDNTIDVDSRSVTTS